MMATGNGRRMLLRYLCLCRLHRPTDLILLLLGGIWASLLASDGQPAWLPMLALLLAAALVRCAAWILNDWLDARLSAQASESFIAQGLIPRIRAQQLFAALLGLALMLILPWGEKLLYLAAATPLLLLGLPLIRTRLFLTQIWLSLCFAWIIPLAWAAQGAWPDETGWLLFTAMALWSSAFTTLYALPRSPYEQRLGIRSLAQLFGEQTWLFVLLMQAAALGTLWVVGEHAGLGLFFFLGLLVAVLLLPWQLWLLLVRPQRGALRCYYSQIWTGVAIASGLAFHYLCHCPAS